MEQNDFASAADAYHKASNYKPNKYFTPSYLLKEALAYEKQNQNDKAIAAYDRLITEFWDAQEVATAKKLKARLETAS
jgi:TolA-binding protein